MNDEERSAEESGQEEESAAPEEEDNKEEAGPTCGQITVTLLPACHPLSLSFLPSLTHALALALSVSSPPLASPAADSIKLQQPRVLTYLLSSSFLPALELVSVPLLLIISSHTTLLILLQTPSSIRLLPRFRNPVPFCLLPSSAASADDSRAS